MNDLMLYSFIGLVIMYILYAKGMILADFNFVSSQEAMNMLDDKKDSVAILDVRTEGEYYDLGHIKDAILIPLQELESRLDELSEFKEQKIIVYCATGSRSVSASRILHKRGYNPYNLNGGINTYKRKGY